MDQFMECFTRFCQRHNSWRKLEFQKLEWYHILGCWKQKYFLWPKIANLYVGLLQVATDGTGDHRMLVDLQNNGAISRNGFYISVLAQSASILITDQSSWRGAPGLIFQLDHRNQSSGEKEFRITHCKKLESNESDCQTVQKQNVLFCFNCSSNLIIDFTT